MEETSQYSPELAHISSVVLCLIPIEIDGKTYYAFELNEQLKQVQPFGGAVERVPGEWESEFGFSPHKPNSKDLRGNVPTEFIPKENQLNLFARALAGGLAREDATHCILRELGEELFPLVYGENQFTHLEQSQVKIQYVASMVDRSHSPKYSRPQQTYRRIEIYKVRLDREAQDQILAAAERDPRIVLLTKDQVLNRYSHIVQSGDMEIDYQIAETCKFVMQYEQPPALDNKENEPLKRKLLDHLWELLELFSKGSKHHLKLPDLELLRHVSDDPNIGRLEKTILIHRWISLLLSSITGFGEGLNILALSKVREGQSFSSETLFMSCVGYLLMFTAGFADDVLTDANKNTVQNQLKNILGTISQEHPGEKMLHYGNLDELSKTLVPHIAAAEAIPDMVSEVLPSLIVTVVCLMLADELALAALYPIAVATYQLAIQNILSIDKEKILKAINKEVLSKVLGKFVSTRAVDILSFFKAYYPNTALLDPLIMFLFGSVLISHPQKQLGARDTMKEGQEALEQLRTTLRKFEITLASEALIHQHCRQIETAMPLGDISQKLDEAEALTSQNATENPEVTARFEHFTVTNFESRCLLDDNEPLSFQNGKVHILKVKSGEGLSTILKALAELEAHLGRTYVRIRKGGKKRDLEVHEDQRPRELLKYTNCGSSITFEDLPEEIKALDKLEKEKREEILNYLKNTGLFTDGELEKIRVNDSGINRQTRCKLQLAGAVANQIPILLLDNVFFKGQSNDTISRISDFLEKIAKHRVVIAGVEKDFADSIFTFNAQGQPQSILDHLASIGCLGKEVSLVAKKFVE